MLSDDERREFARIVRVECDVDAAHLIAIVLAGNNRRAERLGELQAARMAECWLKEKNG